MAQSAAPGRATPVFRWPVRVYWEDTDAGGVVYYANYLCFLERARSEWLRARGIDQRAMREQEQAQLVVRSINCRYLKPAVLDDELDVITTVSELKKASFTFIQVIERNKEKLLEAEVRAACIDALELRPRRFPKRLAATLAPLV